jgi:hypothetical protein
VLGSQFRQLTIFEKICGVAPLPLHSKDIARNGFLELSPGSVLIQNANNTFLSVYLCSQYRIRTCKITLQSCTRLPITSPDYKFVDINHLSCVIGIEPIHTNNTFVSIISNSVEGTSLPRYNINIQKELHISNGFVKFILQIFHIDH